MMKIKGKEVIWGAIFMSNKKTKKECLHRSLFGLPDVQSNIVKRVKRGMMLFLFEYERRLLHGVFQAASDGAINIEPHAFRSSGKSFAAQVRVKRIWFCDPLAEPEFSVAIKGNYFTDKMFNFLLSQDQVSSLLHMFSAKKRIDVQPYRKKGVSSEMDESRTDGGLEGRARHAQLEDDGVHGLNTIEYDPYFPNFEHRLELASPVGFEDRYVPDRSLEQYSGFSLDPNYTDPSHRSSMELDAEWSSLGHTNQPDVSVSRSDNLHFRHVPGLAVTTSGGDGGYHPDRIIELPHNTGTLLDPGFSYSNHPFSTSLGSEGNTSLRIQSPPFLTAYENEDYISLSAYKNDDAVHSFQPFSGKRYFTSNTPAGIICEENREKPENVIPYSRQGILCEETNEQISENLISHPRPDIFCEKMREQESEYLIPYSPPSGIFGRETKNVESRKLEGFSYADHDQRRSVFSRLSGFSGTLPNKEKKNINFEGDNALSADDLIQRLFQKQKKKSFCSVFSRLSRGERSIRTDVKVPVCNDFKRKRDADGVDDKCDAEIEIARMKRTKRMVRFSDGVKAVNSIKMHKRKVDEKVTQNGRDLCSRQSQTKKAMSSMVVTEDNVKRLRLDSVVKKDSTEIGPSHMEKADMSSLFATEENAKPIMVVSVGTIEISGGEEMTRVGLSQAEEAMSSMVVTEDNEIPSKDDSGESQRLNADEEMTKVGLSPVAETSPTIVIEKMTEVGLSQAESSMVTTEENVKSMKDDSSESQGLNADEEMTKVGLSQVAETETAPTITSVDKDAEMEPSYSTVHDEKKNEVEDFISLDFELNQQT